MILRQTDVLRIISIKEKRPTAQIHGFFLIPIAHLEIFDPRTSHTLLPSVQNLPCALFWFLN